jgi:hypothetical protein
MQTGDMSIPANIRPSVLLDRPSRSLLAVSAIHDGYQAELEVHDALSKLRRHLGEEPDILCHSWAVRKLEAAPDIRAVSIRQSVAADVILIATSHLEGLPEHVCRWLDTVLREQEAPRAVVVMATCGVHPTAHAEPCIEALKQIALRWQTDFVGCASSLDSAAWETIISILVQRQFDGGMANLPSASSRPHDTTPLPETHVMNRADSAWTQQEVEAVRECAYHLWLDAGCPAGREVEFWLQAEQQLQMYYAARRSLPPPRAPDPQVTLSQVQPAKNSKQHENKAPNHRHRNRSGPRQFLQPVSAHIRPGRRACGLSQLVRVPLQQPAHTAG